MLTIIMVRVNGPRPQVAKMGWVYKRGMKVDKDKFDALLGRLLRQAPEKTQTIKGSPAPKPREPIIPNRWRGGAPRNAL
jgi:hypothetical protein